MTALGLAFWLFRQRLWCFTVYVNGFVQVTPGGTDEVFWSQVREVIQIRLKGYEDRTVRLAIIAPAGRVEVNPVNNRSRSQLFTELVVSAERHQVPVRVEWEEVE